MKTQGARKRGRSEVVAYTHHPRQQRHRPTLNTLETFQQMPPSHLLQLRVAAPWPNRHLVPRLHHILEPGVHHVLFLQIQDPERLSHLLARFDEDFRPPLEDVVRRYGAVVGTPVHRVFHLLVPPAGLEVSNQA